MRNHSITPIINGLSDHDAQLITLHSYTLELPLNKYMLIRSIDDHRINDFLTKISYENWETVFSTDDVNIMFNSFLNTYLKTFYSSFPLKRVHINKKHKNWITSGILLSCNRKRELFIACRNNNNPDLLKHYIKYCKILSAVIKDAKKLNYADKIKKASNKNKTIWTIVNLESNKTLITSKINTLILMGFQSAIVKRWQMNLIITLQPYLKILTLNKINSILIT